MNIEDYYTWSDNWRIETIERPHGLDEDTEYFLENLRGGKIIIDKPVNDVLEFLATADKKKTFAEIDRLNIVSSTLLVTILTVFTRVGVLDLNIEERIANQSIGLDVLRKSILISVVIINYNGMKHLPALMNSLILQTYGYQEIIVVDNCSTDNSCRWISTHFPQVKLLELEKNTGFAAGVNAGIREAKSDFILVLNNDIVLDNNAMYHLIRKTLTLQYGVNAKKWAAVVPKMMLYNNPAFINAIGNSLYPITWGSDNFIGSVDFGQFDHFKKPMSACFGAVLLNREALNMVGPLDPHYKFYYEDMDWSFRAQLHGYAIESAPKAVFYHKFGASMNLKSQAFKLRYIVGNRLYFTLKILESQTLRRFLRNYILEDIKSALIYLKRRNFSLVGAYIWGYARFLFSLPALCPKRNQLQEKREDKGVSDADLLAKSAPLNTTFMQQGVPLLDVYSLRTNYAFLEPRDNDIKPQTAVEDITAWRLRPPSKNKRSAAKVYMEFSFYAAQTGHYDIHLLGLIKNKSDRTVYLDGQLIPQTDVDKKNKKLIMNFLAGKNIPISQGRHILELGWRSQVYAVVVRMSNAPDGQGDTFRETPPWTP